MQAKCTTVDDSFPPEPFTNASGDDLQRSMSRSPQSSTSEYSASSSSSCVSLEDRQVYEVVSYKGDLKKIYLTNLNAERECFWRRPEARKKCNFSILQSDLFAFLHFSFHFISKNILKLLKGISFYAFIRGEIEKDIKRFRTIYHLIFLFDIFWVQKYERTTSGVGGGVNYIEINESQNFFRRTL